LALGTKSVDHASRSRLEPGSDNAVQSDTRNDSQDLFFYLLLLRRRLGFILFASAGVFVATGLIAKFAIARWYQARAVIRPVTQSMVQGRLIGGPLPIGGSLGLGMLGGEASNEAQKYLTILNSYAFMITLADKHHLRARLGQSPARGWFDLAKKQDSKWHTYRMLQARFYCDFSPRTGNLSLYYRDRDRKEGVNVLGFFINDLRDKLRAEAVQDATSALDSMKQQAQSTPDALLQTELYQLVARQVQQKMLAQAQADFAFQVLEPPVASDRPYSPQIVLDSVVMGFFTAMFLAAVVLLRQSPYGEVLNTLLLPGKDRPLTIEQSRPDNHSMDAPDARG
jgi:hypothetical protein